MPNVKLYMPQGGDRLVVGDGAVLSVEAGGTFCMEPGSILCNDLSSYSVATIAGSSVKGASAVNIVTNSAAISATVDFYTVPEGKRLIIDYYATSLPGGGANTVAFFLKSGANYHAITGFNASDIGGSTIPFTYIAEEGETIAYSTTTNSATNIRLFGRLFDNTSALKSVKILALANGNNTLYTAPANTHTFFAYPLYSNGTSAFFLYNSSGATRTYTLNLVPPGGNPAANNQLSTFSLTNNSNANTNAPFLTSIPSGYSINVTSNSGAAGQFCWINIIEAPV